MGSIRVTLFILIFAAAAFAKAEALPESVACDAKAEGCDYYLCMESKYHCGAKAYLVNFAHKYCIKSQRELIPKMETHAGREWTRKTIQCLINNMQISTANLEAGTKACTKIQNDALEAHPRCYLQSGFCELPFRDKLHVLASVKKEILKKNFSKQAYRIMKQCARKS